MSASVRLNGRSARSALCLLSFLFANRRRKVVLRVGQTDHTHATVSPVYLWICRIRIAALTRDRTVFLHGMCVSSLDLGAVRKHVVQAGQRFNLGSLRVFGSQSFPSLGITVGDFAAKFIRSETRGVYFWHDDLAQRDSICRSGVTKVYDTSLIYCATETTIGMLASLVWKR